MPEPGYRWPKRCQCGVHSLLPKERWPDLTCSRPVQKIVVVPALIDRHYHWGPRGTAMSRIDVSIESNPIHEEDL